MAKVVEFKKEKVNIDELKEKEERASAELHALNNRVQMGYKPKTKEEAEEILETMLAPFKIRKQIAREKGEQYKTPFEEIGEMMDEMSDKEIESGLVVVRDKTNK